MPDIWTHTFKPAGKYPKDYLTGLSIGSYSGGVTFTIRDHKTRNWLGVGITRDKAAELHAALGAYLESN